MAHPPTDVIETIPDPELVRTQLARTIRQEAILRGLLRLAGRKRQSLGSRHPHEGEASCAD